MEKHLQRRLLANVLIKGKSHLRCFDRNRGGRQGQFVSSWLYWGGGRVSKVFLTGFSLKFMGLPNFLKLS